VQGPPQASDGVEDDDPAIFAEINITPLTDVFLVLLIIFMVVSTTAAEAQVEKARQEDIVSEKALQVQTPQGTGDTPLLQKDVVISILPDGTLFVEDEQVRVEALEAKLSAVKGDAATTRVVIRGDQAATYELVMKVITTARAVGLSDVALASRTD
jgi:biopolymer transport protein ExbD